MFQLGLTKLVVPYDTVLLSVFLYVVIPLTFGYFTRVRLIRAKGFAWFQSKFLPRLKPFTIIGLLLTLIILFSFQGGIILSNPIHILLIAVPLTIQTYLVITKQAVVEGPAFGPFGLRLLTEPCSAFDPFHLSHKLRYVFREVLAHLSHNGNNLGTLSL